MQEFLLLEQELTKLEDSGFNPTKAASILPPSVYASPDESTANAESRAGVKTRERVAELVRHLNPHVLPELAGSAINGAEPSGPDTPSESAGPSMRPHRDPTEPVEALWWDIVGPSTSSSLLFGAPDEVAAKVNGVNGIHSGDPHAPEKQVPKAVLPPLAPALAAAMPHVPWLGYSATPYETSAGLSLRSPRKVRSKDTALSSPGQNRGKNSLPVSKKNKKKKAVKADTISEHSLAAKMRRNCETLGNIRRVGATFARESTLGDLVRHSQALDLVPGDS